MGDGNRIKKLKRCACAWALPLICFVVGLAIGAVGVFVLHQTHRLPGGGTRQPEAFSEVPKEQAGELAERFRPWLEFDSGERWRPLNVSYLLDEGDQRFCDRGASGPECQAVENAEEFDRLTREAGALGPATYLDIAGGKVDQYHGPERCGRLLDCGTPPRSAIYYHVIESNDRFYIDYWWFLRFNHFPRSRPSLTCRSQKALEASVCDEHEGDWEGVTVVTPPDEKDKVDYVVYAAHKGTFRYTASQLQMRGAAETRPTVYVAQGSHASYPQRCAGGCSQPPALAVDGLVDLPESSFDGEEEWARNRESCVPDAPGSCLESLTGQAWTSWPGQWGAGCGDACGRSEFDNSPHSPGLQTRYQTPWCSSQNGILTCDGRALRCGDWLGPQVVAVACDPLALARAAQASEATEPGRLALVFGEQERSLATTPGVVQELGRPLQPGDSFAAIADGAATQVLVRAEEAGVVVEDRFSGLAQRPGDRIVLSVTHGTNGPTVLANGQRPVEERILQEAP